MMCRLVLYIIIAIVGLACKEKEPVVVVAPLEIVVSTDETFLNQAISFSLLTAEEGKVYTWTFGDGDTIVGIAVAHAYSEVGDYVIKVIDDVGNGAFTKVSIILSSDIKERESFLEWLSQQNKPQICAHRGVHYIAPENSLTSIQQAIDADIPVVEIDVRLTKDGIPVLMHDATIGRTTNGEGDVEDFMLQELQSFLMLNHNQEVIVESVPTLAKALELARGKVYLDLDIDTKAPFKSVAEIVKRYGMQHQVFYYTSDASAVEEIINGKALAMPILKEQNDIDYYKTKSTTLVHLTSATMKDELLEQVKAHQWFTFKNAYVNSNTTPLKDNYKEVDTYRDKGISIIQTDYPEDLNEYLQ